MRLKIYHAPNIGAALALVRDELGPDALILASRAVDGGVELTAAQDHLPAHVATSPAISKALLAPVRSSSPPTLPSLPALPIAPTEVARIGTMRWHGVPTALAARLGRGNLSENLGTELRFAALPSHADGPPLLLVGPPGAGKTLTVARLATRLKLSSQTSMVITADGRRAGATEQLAAFTRLLGLTLIVADTPNQLARAVARRVGREPVLIDMPSLNPFDPTDQAFLRDCQAIVDAQIALVLPAGLDPTDAHELAAGYRQLGATHLILTRLDQSRRLGGVLAAGAAGLAFTEAGVSSAVADGLIRVTPDFLADRLSHSPESETAPAPSAASLSPFAAIARVRAEQPRTSL